MNYMQAKPKGKQFIGFCYVNSPIYVFVELIQR